MNRDNIASMVDTNIIVPQKGTKKGIIREYEDKYGVTIDKYLLIATVTYRYTVVSDDKLYLTSISVN